MSRHPRQADFAPEPHFGSRLGMLTATALGCGYLRPAPGTWAAAAAALCAYAVIILLPQLFHVVLIVAALLATIAGLGASGTAIRRTGLLDPSIVVIDEVAGMWLALCVLPTALLVARPISAVVVAWLLFRLFDIGKPWPLNRMEELPGAVGIMTDDLAAGALAGMLTLAVFH
jgi:phosphatidylglycerophosphatase A